MQSTPTRTTVLVAVSTFLALGVGNDVTGQRRQKNAHEAWPFGIIGNAQSSLRGRDLFNLGRIGAKAWDAARKEPKATQSGRRRFASNGKPDGDDGPKRLIVRALFGGGPGQKAGLRIDDVIVGVDQDRFENGSRTLLAAALLRAESATGSLILQVERGGEPLALEVKVRKAGKAAADPTRGKHRDKLVKQALGWLADKQGGDGGFPATLGGMNGRVVNTCLAGLAWIAGGSSQRAGKHRANIQKAVAFVRRGLYAKNPFAGRGGAANWDQSTWAFAHAAIFFGELQLRGRDKKLQPFLQTVTDELCKRQEVSGGYGHGPGGKNALGYVELNILGGFVLSGLGLAKQSGCKFDAGVVDRLSKYLEASASADGGVGYSTNDGQRGHGNIGRTAVTWLGAVGLGLGDAAFTKKMRDYVRQNVTAVLRGHASLMQHIMLAGIAANALGDEVAAEYWNVMRRDLVLARAPDGSFQPRPWHESLLMSSNTDVSMGDVWTTASWTIALAAGRSGRRGGLPGWLGKRVK